MSNDLKLPQVGKLTFPQWQDWLARYNAVLTERETRIQKLEAALREIASIDSDYVSDIVYFARKALEGTDE
jgi:hypothetical protein